MNITIPDKKDTGTTDGPYDTIYKAQVLRMDIMIYQIRHRYYECAIMIPDKTLVLWMDITVLDKTQVLRMDITIPDNTLTGTTDGHYDTR